MDSLLANYASSDEEEHEELPQVRPITPAAEPDKWEAKAGDGTDEDLPLDSSSKRGGIFKSLPPPKSSLFNSLPPPKSQPLNNHKPGEKSDRRAEVDERDKNSKPKSTSSSLLFSSLPPPKSSESSSSSNSRKVVQFRPPTMMNAYASRVDDDDEEEEEEEDRKRKRSKSSISTTSASSFLSSIPAPKHSATLGALPSASGTGRRSMLETDTPASSASAVADEVVNTNDGSTKDQSSEIVYDYSIWSSGSESNAYYSGYADVSDANQPHEVNEQSNGLSGENYAYYGGYGGYGVGTPAGDDANVNPDTGSYEAADYSYVNEQNVGYNYEGSYGDYGNNAQYENNWANATALPEASVENLLQLPGKRGRKDVPPQIIEVKQDELMKNRPREDQVKLTGIAFGPGYQAPASSKAKPTKLHKRKHQIGSLYFDMKQKETELAERRSQGFLTKAQTQAKYGW